MYVSNVDTALFGREWKSEYRKVGGEKILVFPYVFGWGERVKNSFVWLRIKLRG